MGAFACDSSCFLRGRSDTRIYVFVYSGESGFSSLYRTEDNLEALARSRAEEVRAFLLKHGPGLGKRVNIASKGGLPDVRSGTAQVEIQLR